MYLHQHPNWWQFRYSHEAILSPLAAVRRRQGEVMGRCFSLGFEQQCEAMAASVALDTITSAEIEDEWLNEEQVRSSVAMRLGLPCAGLPTPSHYIDGVVQMMLDATQRYDTLFTEDRLMGWHCALFPMGTSGSYMIDVGKYRTHPMQIVSGAMGHECVHYEAPEPQEVPHEMDRFLFWLNAPHPEDGVLRAAIAHLLGSLCQ